ncbi:hypothetical protein A8V01_00590 [Novosphingobium guangzhouense]|uniref:Transporter n=2 Tax=Novosphingobium guangzhouense TaxID=1850347 RepID=A0A2K2G6Q5_9SPHN|nr:hypothetical protein A8V01_00590 [Novosphingobium guangzhouense]
MTVEEAVLIAIARHPTLAAATSEVKAAHTEVKAARSGYLPSFSASGGPQETSPDEWAYEVTAAQMIYDWGLTRNKVDGARASERQRRAEWFIARDDAASDVIETYLDVLLAQSQTEIDLAQIATLEDLVHMTGERADSGYADRSEPERAELELARARQRLASDEGQAADAAAQYETLVGTRPDNLQQPAPLSMSQRIKGQDIDALIDEAPLYRKALEDTRSARAQFGEARAGILPRLNLEATALSREIGGRMESDAVVAVRLRMSPMQGLSAFHRIDAAQQKVNAAQWTEAATRRDISRQLRNLIVTSTALEDQALALRNQVSGAGELSDVYREQFAVGRRDIVDLVTIQREHFDARRALNEITLQSIRIQYRIAASLGKLSELLPLPEEDL